MRAPLPNLDEGLFTLDIIALLNGRIHLKGQCAQIFDARDTKCNTSTLDVVTNRQDGLLSAIMDVSGSICLPQDRHGNTILGGNAG